MHNRLRQRPIMATVAMAWWIVFAVMSAFMAMYRYETPRAEPSGVKTLLFMELVLGTAIFVAVTFGLAKGHRWAWVVSAAILGLSGSHTVVLAIALLMRVLVNPGNSPFLWVALNVAAALPILVVTVALSSDTASGWFAERKPPAPQRGTPQWLVIATGVCLLATIVITATQVKDPADVYPVPSAATIFAVHAAGVGLAIVALIPVIQLFLRRPGGQFGFMAMCAAAAMYPHTDVSLVAVSPGLAIVPAVGFVLAASIDLRPTAPIAGTNAPLSRFDNGIAPGR